MIQELAEEPEDLTLNIKFPEGYPFEYKTVQFNASK
jgi:hypothetical protein